MEKASFMVSKPIKRIPKPINVSPHDFVVEFLKKNRIKPKPMTGRAIVLTENLNAVKLNATIHAVTVVPMLAPMITPIA